VIHADKLEIRDFDSGPASDLDIYRVAKRYIDLYAARMADQMLENGDAGGAARVVANSSRYCEAD
jgi:hypothetical protein